MAIVLAIAAVHAFRLGSYLRGSPFRLYYSFASDILIPIAAYMLLCGGETNLRFLRGWHAKAAVVLGAASLAEVLQGFGVPMLGRTFDPLDFVMFALGVLIAVLLDRAVTLLCAGGRRRLHAPQ